MWDMDKSRPVTLYELPLTEQCFEKSRADLALERLHP